MTLENARVLYAHRLKLGKNVDDILLRFPELKDDGKKNSEERKPEEEQPAEADKKQPPENPRGVKPVGKKPKG